ncbi:NUDIX domain-containing protein [Zhihengliuella sp.]|uniref:NUDIX hydrolase n=1 Tax=Zhihengliuella sp. TaxID=1954483 RepID=UPI002810FD1F|nr:NUDIX domain-containing protein [Zhihengliuella sp.]
MTEPRPVPAQPAASGAVSSAVPPAARPWDTRLAAYCVVVREGRILLALWDMRASRPDFRPRWTLPGGGVDLGEQAEAGAVREVAEETGYDVAVTSLLGVETGVIPSGQRLHGEGRPLQTVAVMYAAEIVGGDLAHEVGGTTSRAAWFDLDEVASLDRVARVDEALRLYRASSG